MVDWQEKSVGDIFEFKNGLNKAKEFFGFGTPIINYMDVYKKNGIYACEICGRVSLSFQEIKRFEIHKGDVFFTRTSETPEEVGMSCVLLDDVLNGVFSGFVLRGHPITEDLDLEYCKYCFQTAYVRNEIIGGATYTTRALTNGTQLSKIKIPVPPKAEQRRIAEALSDVDSLIESLEKLIAKKKAIKQGAMQELLTGKKRLPGFTDEWVEKKFGDICPEIVRGQSLSSDKFVMGNIPVIAGGKVPAGYHNRSNRSGKTITISASGAAGYVAMHDYPIFATDCSTISENASYDIEYLYYLLLSNQEEIYKRQTGGAQPHIHPKDIKPLLCKVSLKLEEQTAIATVLSDMDSEITGLEEKLTKYRNVKTGMMQTLLTGKIRLPEETVTEEATIAKQEETVIVGTKKGHNRQFDDAVAIAAIVNAFDSEKYPLGRKKVQKLLYLMRRKQEVDTTEFKKKAAGPYAEGIRYKGGEKILKNNGYANIVESPDGAIFSKGKNIGAALKYVSEWNWQSVIDWLLAKFRYVGKDKLEVLATIDMAICDLIHSDITPSFETVKHLIASNKEWKEKLNKKFFSDEDIKQAIDECYQLFNYSRG